MADITILLDANDVEKNYHLNSEHGTTVEDLLSMIGDGTLLNEGVLVASKTHVLKPGTYTWTQRMANNKGPNQPEGHQTNKRSGGVMIEPPLKRTLTDKKDVFFSVFPNGSLEVKTEGTLLEFSKNIADTENNGIFERDCFGPLAEKVKHLSERKDDGTRLQSGLIITGTSGIGKTFFGFFLAHQLIKAGEIVAFNYRNEKRVVFAPTVEELKGMDVKDGRRFLLDLLEKHQQGELAPLKMSQDQKEVIGNNPHFWGMANKDETLWKLIIGNQQTWLLVDLHRDDPYEDGRQDCKIVVTSTLRNGNWPDLDDGGDLYSRKLYMAPLELEEAKKIVTAIHPNIAESEITARYERFGGSARALFNAPELAQDKVDEAFDTGIGNLLDPNSENPARASVLVHILANDEFVRVGRKFASQQIANRVVDAAIDNKELMEKVWLEATSGKAGRDITGARGIFAERLWHRAVGSANKVRFKELTPMGQPDKKAEYKQLTVSFDRTRRFTKSDLSDLLEMNVGDYCLPDNAQFPSVDSIAVLAENPWASVEEAADAEGSEDPKSNQSNGPAADGGGAPSSSGTLGEVDSAKAEPVGIMFQMAIGRNHKLAHEKPLRDIDAKMDALVEGFTRGKSPLYLIYVTETADSFSSNRLNYLKKGGTAYADPHNLPKDLARIKQFAISFEKLTDGSLQYAG